MTLHELYTKKSKLNASISTGESILLNVGVSDAYREKVLETIESLRLEYHKVSIEIQEKIKEARVQEYTLANVSLFDEIVAVLEEGANEKYHKWHYGFIGIGEVVTHLLDKYTLTLKDKSHGINL